jgi:hypothetical protein
VGTAGDVNNDGYSDVIIGARRYSHDEPYEGGAFVYYGSATGLSATPDWSAEGNEENAWFGVSVSTAGDVNNDGYSDVIIGMDNWVSGCAGKAFVYHGSETGLSDTPNWSLVYTPTEACFGASVGTAGDVNNDGFDDVIIGAPYYSNEQTKEGAAFVFHGSGDGLSLTPNWMVESNQTEAYYGISVGTAGDITNDGYDDVLVGAPYFTNVESFEGLAFVYYGSGSGLSTSPNWTAEINQENASFGSAVASAGDVNRDGYSDVLVGAPHYSNGNNREGGAFLYLGSDLGLSATPDWTTESDHNYAYYGNSLGTAGDVNGNGVQDIIVGAYGYETDNDFAGKAYVYHDTVGYLVFLPVVMR